MNDPIDKRLIQHFWNNTSSICLLIDSNGIIQKANKFTEAILGKALKNIPASSIFVDFTHSLDIPDYEKSSAEKTLLHINTQSNIPASYHFNFYKVDNTVLAVGEANSMDIELMKNTLVELNGNLNNLTRELHKKNADLKKLNELKNNLLGIAAHDLRNPLGYIGSFMEILMEQLADKIEPKHIKILKTIKQSTEFSLSLLNELLDITAIESGKLTLDFKKFNIVDHISHFVELNNLLGARKNIKVSVLSAAKSIDVEFDKVKIEQVLNNLISNAIKFSMPETEVIVKLSKNETSVKIEVKDQGQGIPKNELENIFRPFTKTSVKATANEKSTGLGLAIVLKIVEGHKGKISVESEIGKGTSFHIELPLTQAL